jgi:hypothetical protein
MRDFRAQVADRQTGRSLSLTVRAKSKEKAETRLYWLGFLVAKIEDRPPPQAVLTGEDYNAIMGKGSQVSDLLALAELPWMDERGFDRHILLEQLVWALSKAEDQRAEVAAWQWMADLPEFRHHLTRDLTEPISMENVVSVNAPFWLQKHLTKRGNAERAEDVYRLFNEGLRGRVKA